MSNTTQLRHTMSTDAQSMRDIAADTGILSINSIYCYAIMARHFYSTCLVAEYQNRIVGYIIAYHPPGQPNNLFIWQVGVIKPFQGKGLAGQMLIALINELQPGFVEATIAKENLASINLFKSVGRYFNVNSNFSEKPFFGKDSLGKDEQAEHLMKLGPFKIKNKG